MMVKGSMSCSICDKTIGTDVAVCCTYADHEDGSYDDPVCVECCEHPRAVRWEWMSVAGGTYERCD